MDGYNDAQHFAFHLTSRKYGTCSRHNEYKYKIIQTDWRFYISQYKFSYNNAYKYSMSIQITNISYNLQRIMYKIQGKTY